MWIQSALSCLLLVVLRAELDCKGIEIALQSGIVAMPMDVCRRVPETTTTAGYSTANHCYDGKPVAAMYHNSNCTGTPEIYSLSDDDSDQPDEESDVDSDIDEGFTAYCDKPACNVVIYGVVTLTACDQEPTGITESGIIADYCTEFAEMGTQYTCSGDNVVLKTYTDENCTGEFTEVTYVDGAIECTEYTSGAHATKITCSVASFSAPITTTQYDTKPTNTMGNTQSSQSSSTNVVYHVYGMVWALFVYGMVYISL
eukprot:512051_1